MSEELKNGISGATAGFVSVVALYPLDLIKTRLQAQQHGYLGLRHGLRAASASGMSGLYRGVAPSLLGSSIAWGMYFFIYAWVKARIMSAQEEETGKAQTMGSHLLAALIAGLVTQVATNPLWVIKTNTQLQQKIPVREIMRSIYRTRGVFGFWAGFVPSLFGIAQGSVQFMLYEQLKEQSLLEGLVASTVSATVISKTLSTSLTYPYQVFRTRAQSMTDVTWGLKQITRAVYKEHGVRGFYYGLSACLLRIMPQTCVTFLTWELMKSGLSRLSYFNPQLVSNNFDTLQSVEQHSEIR